MVTLVALTALLAQSPATVPAEAQKPSRATADADVAIYLPPSYATDKSKRYPVVYLLHGYGGRDDTFNGRLATLPDSSDNQIKAGTVKEMIVVMPNSYTLHKGS